jgi:Divergent InlB B-repeat domain/Fibronectin type III domain
MFQEKSFLKLFLLSFLFTLLTVLSSPAAITAAQLTLSWSDNSTNEDGFRIERRTGTTGTYVEIVALGVNAASYTDVNLANGTTYCYRVRAYNVAGASGYSNEQCATTSVATSYVLTVAKSGTGEGVVTATGINCGTDCNELYTSGSSVTLTATASSGSSFAGWSGTGCTTGTVTVNGNMTCTATFNINSFTLTVAKSGTGDGVVTATGINCGTDCSELYASGTSVTLTAIPAGGSSFAGWSGTGWNGSGCQGTAGCTMTISSNTAVTATFVNNQADKVGIYRPSTGEWFLDRNGDGCSTDKCVRSLATAGAVPVVGDWNRSGVTLLGLFLPATAQWRLDINGNGTLEDCGIDNCLGTFGQGTDIPIAGKWSSTGYDRIGVFRPSNERWYMDVNGNGSLNNCSKDRCANLSVYRDGDLPVTGDWSGDGVTKVGLYRPSTGQWFLDRNGDRSWDGCRRDLCISSFGTTEPEDLPVTGDWNGTGKSKIGLFRPQTGEWLLDLNGNNQWDGCDIDLCLTDFGDVGDLPVAGKW